MTNVLVHLGNVPHHHTSDFTLTDMGSGCDINSQSVSLTGEKLLNTDEVRRVKRPHQIITSRDHPAMMCADLSQWMFNKMLGLGDMEHNRRLQEEQEQKRPIITDTKQEIALGTSGFTTRKTSCAALHSKKGAMGGGLDDD